MEDSDEVFVDEIVAVSDHNVRVEETEVDWEIVPEVDTERVVVSDTDTDWVADTDRDSVTD